METWGHLDSSLIPRLSACVKNLFSFHSQVEGKLRGVPICGVGLCVLVTSYNSCNICNSKYVKEWNIQTVLETCYKDVHNFHFLCSVWVTSKLRWLVSGVSLLVTLRTLTALDASCCITQDRYSTLLAPSASSACLPSLHSHFSSPIPFSSPCHQSPLHLLSLSPLPYLQHETCVCSCN